MEFADFPVDAYLFPQNDFFSLGGEKYWKLLLLLFSRSFCVFV